MRNEPRETREEMDGRQARGNKAKLPSALTEHMGQASIQEELSPHDVNAAFKGMSFCDSEGSHL